MILDSTETGRATATQAKCSIFRTTLYLVISPLPMVGHAPNHAAHSQKAVGDATRRILSVQPSALPVCAAADSQAEMAHANLAPWPLPKIT